MERADPKQYVEKLRAFNVSENYQEDIAEVMKCLKRQGILSNSKLFDFGCGTGYFCKHVANDMQCWVEGIDSLVLERDMEFWTCHQGEMYELQTIMRHKMGTFTYVTMLHVLNHVTEQPFIVFSHMKRLLRDGGYMVILTNNSVQKSVKKALADAGIGNFRQFGDETMVHNHTVETICRDAEAVGFDFVERYGFGKPTVNIRIEGVHYKAHTRELLVFRKPLDISPHVV